MDGRGPGWGLPSSTARVGQQEWSCVRHAERKVPSPLSGFRRGLFDQSL